MATANLPATLPGSAPPADPVTVDASTMEKVVVNGDLSKLDSAQRLQWYKARCDAAGLDPRTQPFQYITLQGKLTLYATKGATDQLIANRRLSVEIPERGYVADLGIYEVRCRVTSPDGRTVEDVAALPVAGLKGDNLCNAVMKCITKAKRRTVLSACGLGMLDESEVETIPDARQHHAGALPSAAGSHHARNHDNATGHGSGAYADPKTVAEYRQWLKGFVEDVNSKWLDKNTGPDGEIPHGVRSELLGTFQVSGHLLKWAVSEGIVNAPDDVRAGQRDKFVAVAWERQRGGMIEEAETYARRKWREARQALAALNAPEPAPPSDPEVDGDPDVDYEHTGDAADDNEPGSRG